MEYIEFDVMLDGTFIGTFKMPLSKDIVDEYVNGEPVIKGAAFSDYVEKMRPSLRGKPYKIY